MSKIKSKYINNKIISVFDVDNWDFENAEVIREWRNIDILIREDDHASRIFHI